MHYMLSIFIKNLEANYISFSKLNEQKNMTQSLTSDTS